MQYENGEKGTPYENDKFIALAPYNRELLMLLFPKQQVPRYKHGHLKGFPEKFTKHMQKLRDTAVDEILLQHLVKNDPMGDHNAAQGLPKDANRLELFKAADVPKIINIMWMRFMMRMERSLHPGKLFHCTHRIGELSL